MPSFKGKLAAGSPRGQRGRCFEQTEHKAEDLKRFLDEAADGRGGSCLACINAHPGAQRGKRDVRQQWLPCSCIRWGPRHKRWGQSFQKSFYSSIHENIQRQREETRLQGVSGSAWSTAGCRLLIHHSMLNFTSSCHHVNHGTSKSATHPSCFLTKKRLNWEVPVILTFFKTVQINHSYLFLIDAVWTVLQMRFKH